jgi:glutathione peroxidase
MQSFIWPILLCAFTALSDGQYLSQNDSKVKVSYRDCYDSNDESVYDYTFETIDGQRNVSLNEYRNYTLLIVNVATYWGFTYTYPQLNALKQQFINKSFEIIAFPCNQFGQQEPGGTGDEIINGIKYVRPGNGFVPEFVMTKKIDVNGVKQHPLYSYLKRSCPSTKDEFSKREKLFYDNLHARDIRWNWEKFLIDPHSGKPVKRYDASYEPINIASDIQKIAENKIDYTNSLNESYHVINETELFAQNYRFNNETINNETTVDKIEPEVSLFQNKKSVKKIDIK